MKTTIDPGLQESAVSALAGRVGGIALLDSRNGDVRALAGQAFSAPQPPGLDLQDDHDDRGAGEGRRLPRRRIRNHRRGQRRRPLHRKRQRRVLRRQLPRSLCRVLQRRLRPARARRSATTNWSKTPNGSASTRRRRSTRPRIVAEVDPEESTIPTEIGDELDLGVSAIGQGEVLATPLQMASVAQTIANGGVREPTSIVANEKLRPEAKPVRVMSKKIADELTELMIGVVTGGTGTAGRDPRGPGRRQDRHRRARPPARAKRTPNTPSSARTPGSPPSPPQKKRSWRSACC